MVPRRAFPMSKDIKVGGQEIFGGLADLGTLAPIALSEDSNRIIISMRHKRKRVLDVNLSIPGSDNENETMLSRQGPAGCRSLFMQSYAGRNGLSNV